MKDHKGCIRAFHWSSKAYYAGSIPKEGPEIYFGMYSEEGGTSGEMSMIWTNISGDTLTPQLRVFCDGWSALSLFTDVIEKLGEHDDEDISEEKFIEILKECGFKDLTAYKAPIIGGGQNYKIKLQQELSDLEKRCKEIRKQMNR